MKLRHIALPFYREAVSLRKGEESTLSQETVCDVYDETRDVLSGLRKTFAQKLEPKRSRQRSLDIERFIQA